MSAAEDYNELVRLRPPQADIDAAPPASLQVVIWRQIHGAIAEIDRLRAAQRWNLHSMTIFNGTLDYPFLMCGLCNWTWSQPPGGNMSGVSLIALAMAADEHRRKVHLPPAH